MSPRNILGMVLTLGLGVAFYGYLHRPDCTITASTAILFGAAGLFCGLILDFDHYASLAVSLVKAWKGGQP